MILFFSLSKVKRCPMCIICSCICKILYGRLVNFAFKVKVPLLSVNANFFDGSINFLRLIFDQTLLYGIERVTINRDRK